MDQLVHVRVRYPTVSVLGDGWVEKKDIKHGRTFYFNRKTRRSTWTKPIISILPPGHTSMETKQIHTATHRSLQAPCISGEKSEESGPSWVKVFSSDYNRVYYFNKRTRTSVWENPFTDPENLESRNVLNSSVMLLESQLSSLSHSEKVGDVTSGEPKNSTLLALDDVRLAEAIQRLKEKQKVEEAKTIEHSDTHQGRLQGNSEPFDTSDRFLVKKNISEYKLKNQDFDRTHLWRINTGQQEESAKEKDSSVDQQVLEEVGENVEKITEQYEQLYGQLKQIIQSQKEQVKSMRKEGGEENNSDLVHRKGEDTELLDDLDLYAEDLRKRTKQIYSLIEKTKQKDVLPPSGVGESSGLPGSEVHGTKGGWKPQVPSTVNTLPGLEVDPEENRGPSQAKREEDIEEVFVEELKKIEQNSELSVKEKKKMKHKLKLKKKKRELLEQSKSSSLTLFVDEMEQVKEEQKAIEAEREAKRLAREKYEQIKLLKSGHGDYYKLLGVSSTATSGQVKKAYLKLMIRYHPDKNKRKAATQKTGEDFEINLTEKETTERANLIKDAYLVLSDPWERFIYDKLGLEDYLIVSRVVQAFKNYIMSGVKIKKHGRRSRRIGVRMLNMTYYKPKKRYLWMDFAHETINTGPARILEITNERERKSVKGIRFVDMQKFQKGMKSDVFQKTGVWKHNERYFSIISEERTLDLECESQRQRDFLCARLNLLRVCKQRSKDAFEEHLKLFPMKKKKKKSAQGGKGRGKASAAPQRRKRVVRRKKSASSGGSADGNSSSSSSPRSSGSSSRSSGRSGANRRARRSKQ